jgi:hypothetical protein
MVVDLDFLDWIDTDHAGPNAAELLGSLLKNERIEF